MDDISFNWKDKLILALAVILIIVPPHIFGILLLFFTLLRKYYDTKKETPKNINRHNPQKESYGQSSPSRNYQQQPNDIDELDSRVSSTEMSDVDKNALADVRRELSELSPEQKQFLAKELNKVMPKERLDINEQKKDPRFLDNSKDWK
jgi:pheromone shutdown protein TraB